MGARMRVTDMSDDYAAERPHQIADREYAKRREQLRDGVLMREELAADRRGKVSIDRKIVPFQKVTDHSRGDYSAYVRGLHITPRPLLEEDAPRRGCLRRPARVVT